QRECGPVSGGIVRDGGGGIAGWFVHYVAPRGHSRVLQVGARRRTLPFVLGHLLRDAYDRGAVSVTGRFDASMLPIAEETALNVSRQPPWTLAYSRRPELQRAVE